ncbi:MAG: DUF72 domain-containing protein [Minisyncoccia bacterium]
MKIYIGTSGWQYHHWKSKFYPEDLNPKDWLEFYSKYFNTVEINTSFYHQTRKTTFEKWKDIIKDKNFKFSIKLYRLFTHFRRLNLDKDNKRILKETLNNYFSLKENLGPILIQLPPSLKLDLEKLKKFIKEIKRIREEILLSIEFRNKSWLNDEVYKILKDENVAFCISDSPRWQTDFAKTADFVYVRFHGRPLFAGKYSEDELKKWAVKIKKLKPKKVFIYFNNDFEGYAVENAIYMKKILR